MSTASLNMGKSSKKSTSLRTKCKELYGALKMTTQQKANSPTISVSPAVIGLAVSLLVQTCVGVWWAASLSEKRENDAKRIQTLESTIETYKVYIDDTREKFIRMESKIDSANDLKSLQRQLDVLIQQTERKK